MKTRNKTSLANRIVSPAVVLTAVALFLPPLHAGTITFSDGDFTGWTYGPAFPDTHPVQDISLETSGGNDGAYFRVETTTDLTTVSAFFNPLFTFDPSASDTITAIDFSIDAREFYTFWAGMSLGLAVLQDGQVFIAGGSTNGLATGGWTTFLGQASWYTSDPANWYAAAGPLPPGQSYAVSEIAPDFGPNGSALTFGFHTGNKSGLGIDVGFDNFSVTLHTSSSTSPVAAPDLASTGGLILLALGLSGARACIRQRRPRRP